MLVAGLSAWVGPFVNGGYGWSLGQSEPDPSDSAIIFLPPLFLGVLVFMLFLAS